MAAPQWLLEEHYAVERQLLEQIERWAVDAGLEVTPAREVSVELGEVADLVLRRGRRMVLLDVKRREGSRNARVDLDARPGFRHVSLLWIPDEERWLIMTDSRIPLDLPMNEQGFIRLIDLLLSGK